MLQIKSHHSAPTSANFHQTLAAARDHMLLGLRARAAAILRLLILLLAALLFVLLALMIATGRAEVGGPILGGVLLVGLGAAQFGR